MAGVTTYRIRDWDKAGFEVSQNSRTRGPLKWVAIPTKHDGKGFRRLMRHKEGAAFFGCWCLIVQVAAKCPNRGVLSDDDGPLSSSDLHLKTGAPEELIERALKFLHVEVGWLETVDTGQQPAFDTLQQNVAGCNKVLPTRQDVQDETLRYVTQRDETGAPAAVAGDLPDRADDIPLPENLDASSQFRSCWAAWLKYRREIRGSMRGVTIERQLAMLCRLGPDAACEVIDTSIRNGWKGLFEPKGATNVRGNSQGNSDATRVRNERTDGDFANIPRVHGVGGKPAGAT